MVSAPPVTHLIGATAEAAAVYKEPRLRGSEHSPAATSSSISPPSRATATNPTSLTIPSLPPPSRPPSSASDPAGCAVSAYQSDARDPGCFGAHLKHGPDRVGAGRLPVGCCPPTAQPSMSHRALSCASGRPSDALPDPSGDLFVARPSPRTREHARSRSRARAYPDTHAAPGCHRCGS